MIYLENPFVSVDFAGFWLQVEQEWAEAEKVQLYSPFERMGLDCDECFDPCDAFREQQEEDEW